MHRLLAFFAVSALTSLTALGCANCGQQRPCAPNGPPPGAVLVAPPGTTAAPSNTPWLPEPPAPPAPPPTVSPYPPPSPYPSQSKSIDPAQYNRDQAWKPGTPAAPESLGTLPPPPAPGVQAAPPSPSPGQAPSVRLYPPEVEENPDAAKKIQLRPPEPLPLQDAKPLPKVEESQRPPKVEESQQSKEPAGKPVGIPHFAAVTDHVSTGQRPSLDDGLEWLASHGYKTVLFVHELGESESAARKQVEKRGMQFAGLAVSPTTLTRLVADEFNRIVADTQNGPLFVYDRDGSLTGAMWYLHFRLARQMTDDEARSQVRRLGFNEEQGEVNREMWQAAKKLLSDGLEP